MRLTRKQVELNTLVSDLISNIQTLYDCGDRCDGVLIIDKRVPECLINTLYICSNWVQMNNFQGYY